MYGLLNRAITAPQSAHAVLSSLLEEVGTTGLPAAERSPGLLASVDQHMAAVRDTLLAQRQVPNIATLAGYTEGVLTAAREHGWTAPGAPIDWSTRDWVLTRLLAVCFLARRAGL